ncbi:DUF2254 domain-containing protein [Botryobacter ruber]|uniref:DUF2254 domain-containing protein n=1 Tax=Botryobacter ruber TaxID=2171629 RepID=UPI000E0A2356|nr:DUF2254 domain-containing protein [Botryobacter ruber]
MNARLRKVWDSLRSSYWFVPAIMMVFVLILWTGTHHLDEHLAAAGKLPVRWLYSDDVESMRKLLLTIAASIIGIVGVVFSILMVPLTIAATQFGPRLLRTFLRDTGTHLTLGTFTSTFIFCILVLLQLRDDATYPVPQVSATTGLLFGFICFGMLIYFINHIARSIQASVVIAEVSAELQLAIDHELPDPLPEGPVPSKADAAATEPAGPAHPVMAVKSGYVLARADDELMQLAVEQDLVIHLLNRPGDFIVAGTPLARLWPAAKASDKVSTAVNKAFILGPQRTLVQDVTFGINELVELAVRALSPGINDPFTAMSCLDWLGTALCRTTSRAFPSPCQFDEQGNFRLLSKPITFTYLTDAAFNQIRDYARTSPAVTLRLLDTIAVIAPCARTEEQRKILLHHATLVARGCHIGLPEKADREVVAARYEQVVELLKPGKQEEGRQTV